MSVNAGTVYSELVLDATKYAEGIDKAAEQMKTLGKAMEDAGKKAEANFAASMKKVSEDMTKVGKSLTTKVTLPILGVGAAVMKAGMDFEAGMSEVKAISGATGAELAELEEKAKEMGATTKFSASEAAEALKYMAMAGWDTANMLDGLDGVMMLAAASGEALGLTSDIVTDALTAFGMEARQAGEFADLLASASSNSNTNVALMGESFKYVAPLFGALGYSAEDAALALGLMANAGVKGSRSGTALRSAISNLVNPTSDMAAAMDELKISVTDASGEMLPFKDVMDILREKFGELSEEQKAQYAATIFGKEAMSGMLAIIGASQADYEKLTAATRDYNGAAKEMAETMQDNLKGGLIELGSKLEGVAITLYEILLPHAEKLIETLSIWVDWFAQLDAGTQENIIKLTALAAAIGPALLLAGKLTAGISLLAGWFSKASIGMGLLGKAFTILTGPVGIAVVAIAGIAAVFAKVYRENEEFRNKVNELWGEVVEIFTTAADSIREAWANFWEEYGEEMQIALTAIWENIETIFMAGVDILLEVFRGFRSAFEGDWEAVWGSVKKIAGTAWDALKTLFTNSLGALAKILGFSLGDFVGIWGERFDAIYGIVKNVMEKVIDAVRGAIALVKSLVSSISEAAEKVKEFGNDVIDTAKEKLGSVGDAIKEGFSNLWERGKEFVGLNARGTDYWKGGLTWVGEEGPEIVELPRGAKVHSNEKSMEIAKSGGITQNITINSPTPLTPSEIARKNLQVSRRLAMEWGF